MRPSPSFAALTTALAAGLFLAACQPAARSGTVSALPDEAAARLDDLFAMDTRVNAVAYRLMTANVELCPHVRPIAGWVLHASNQYEGEQNRTVRTRFDLQADLPGVLAVAPGGPAEHAGLRPGDLILKVNGEALNPGVERGQASFRGAEANLQRLGRAFAAGPATLTIRREGAERDIQVSPVPACAYETQVRPAETFRSRADGRTAEITTGYVRYLASDDDLALILGHEHAHNALQHRDGGRDLPRGPGGVEPGPRSTDERDADRLGLIMAARAGYGFEGAPEFWRRFGRDSLSVRFPQLGGQAGSEERARQLEPVVARIRAQRAAGEPIRP